MMRLLLGLIKQVSGLDSPVQGYRILIDPTPGLELAQSADKNGAAATGERRGVG
jgi:hypothetical protein